VVKHYDSSKGDKTVTENDVRKTLQNSKGAVNHLGSQCLFLFL